MMVISLSPSGDMLQSTLPPPVEEMEGKGPLMGSSASLRLWNKRQQSPRVIDFDFLHIDLDAKHNGGRREAEIFLDHGE